LKADWEGMIKDYLVNRENLVALFVLIDSRLEPQKIDLEFITWCGESDIPIVLLFTKADKQSKPKTQSTIAKFIKASKAIFEEAPLYFITSATSGVGKNEVVTFIEEQVVEYQGQTN
jgi:GTP-binding protein